MPSQRQQRHDKVLLQIYIVLPILFVRVIYACVQSFLSTPTSPGRNRWVYLGLLLVLDFVAVSIYTAFGFVVGRAGPRNVAYEEEARKQEGYEQGTQPAQGQGYDAGTSTHQGGVLQGHRRGGDGSTLDQGSGRQGRGGRRNRRIRGPIHMLYDAIAGRGE